MTKDILDSNDGFSKIFKEFVQIGKTDEWLLIDLRPFTKEFYYAPYMIGESVYRMLSRYDMLIIPKTDEKATNNY